MNSLGQTLAQARQAMGRSVSDASLSTKIPEKYIIAIEQDNFDVLPGAVYARGFLKAYARFLRLDADDIVARYGQMQITVVDDDPIVDESSAIVSDVVLANDKESIKTTQRDLIHETPVKRGYFSKVVYLLLFTVLGVVGWMFFQGKSFHELQSSLGFSQKIPASSTSEVDVLNEQSLSSDSVGHDLLPPFAPVLAIPQQGVPAQEGQSTLGDDLQFLSTQTEQQNPPVVVTSIREQDNLVTESGLDTLIVKVQNPTQVVIQDEGGNVVLDEVLTSEKETTLRLKSPVTLSVQNASGVNATLNGKPIQFPENAKNFVQLKVAP